MPDAGPAAGAVPTRTLTQLYQGAVFAPLNLGRQPQQAHESASALDRAFAAAGALNDRVHRQPRVPARPVVSGISHRPHGRHERLQRHRGSGQPIQLGPNRLIPQEIGRLRLEQPPSPRPPTRHTRSRNRKPQAAQLPAGGIKTAIRSDKSSGKGFATMHAVTRRDAPCWEKRFSLCHIPAGG